ncbi:MAG: prolyl oligopeptidase family serine peptidase [Verrucomicrobia bacterium]|nr:prolyl oligopeptidase family serine peptidase [Verrucomicrobiota bacterium]
MHNPVVSFRHSIGIIATLLFALLHGTAVYAVSDADFLADKLTKVGAEPNDLPYRYYVPANYDPASKYPLIVYLHGSAESGTDNKFQLNWSCWGAYQLLGSSTYPCFMVAPQAYSTWDGTTMDQIVRMVQTLSKTYSIDPDRIYVTGISMGGYGSWSIINRYPFFSQRQCPCREEACLTTNELPIFPSGVPCRQRRNSRRSGSDNAVSGARLAGARVIYTRYADGSHAIWLAACESPPTAMAHGATQKPARSC